MLKQKSRRLGAPGGMGERSGGEDVVRMDWGKGVFFESHDTEDDVDELDG